MTPSSDLIVWLWLAQASVGLLWPSSACGWPHYSGQPLCVAIVSEVINAIFYNVSVQMQCYEAVYKLKEMALAPEGGAWHRPIWYQYW